MSAIIEKAQWNFDRVWLMIADLVQLFTCFPVKDVRPVCSENNSSNITVSVWLSIISCVAATTHIFIYELRPYFFAYDISNPILPVFPLYVLQTWNLDSKLSDLNLTLLSHRCQISRVYLEPVSDYCTWTKTTPQKKMGFLVKSF